MIRAVRSPRWIIWLALLTFTLTLPRIFAPPTMAHEPDKAERAAAVLSALADAGSYRFLHYDILESAHDLTLVGEVSLRDGGRIVMIETGDILAIDPADPAVDDAALRFFRSGGDGWSFGRAEIEDGQLVAVAHETEPAPRTDREIQTSRLVIDTATNLPLRATESGTGPNGPYATETSYLDFGDAIGEPDTSAPDLAATPVAGATPIAAGCGSNDSSPTEIAEVFVAATTAGDLKRAASCFAPDRQPTNWDDVFLGGGATTDDITGCRGLPYTVHTSEIRADVSAIIFIFDRACAIASLDDWQRDLYDADTLAVTTVVVQTDRVNDRWFVRDAFALVPD